MPTVTFEAKLRQGFRTLCVDKNITANLSTSFSVPTALVKKIVRLTVDLETKASVARTEQQYFRTGFANTVQSGYFTIGQRYRIIEVGTTDWNMIAGTTDLVYIKGSEFTAAVPGSFDYSTGKASPISWTVTSNLNCKFPTYIEIDVEKLGLPEGIDCILQLDDGVALEDRGRLLPSGGYEYPNNVQNYPNPFNSNFVSFRTPKYLSKTAFPFVTTLNIPRGRARLFNINTGSLFTPVFTARANKVGVIELQSISSFYNLLGRVKYFASVMSARFGPIGPGSAPYLIGNGYEYPPGSPFEFLNPGPPWTYPGIRRIRTATQTFNFTVDANLIAEVYNLPFVWTLENFVSTTSLTANVDAYKGVGTPHLQATSSVSASSRVDYNSFVAAIQSNASVFCRPRFTHASANITATSSLSCNAAGTGSLLIEIVVPSGNLGARTFAFDFPSNTNVFVDIDWGDGQQTLNIEHPGRYAHTYSNPGTYLVSVTRISNEGQPLEAWRVRQGENRVVDGVSYLFNYPTMVRKCLSFGKLNTNSLANAFAGCVNLTQVPGFLPTTVNTIENIFSGCHTFNDASVTSWTTTNVTNMRGVFKECYIFNQNISSWNTTNVTTMREMFQNALAFNQNITGWNTANVTDMMSMFSGAVVFNQNIGSWNTANVVYMDYMFGGAVVFNQNIGSWNVNKVVGFSGMFSNASAFNGNIENWTITSDTSKILSMALMFNYATAFNRPIGNWNTSRVAQEVQSISGMYGMFNNATSFNQDLSGWCVTLIPTQQALFASNTPAWNKTNRLPVWGTCP